MGNSQILPSRVTLRRWFEETPPEFRFSLKVPQPLVDRYGSSSGGSNSGSNSGSSSSGGNSGPGPKDLGQFLEGLAPLEEKILAIVISPPRRLSLGNGGMNWLENILNKCTYHGYSVAFEFNNSSWFQDLTFNLLKKHGSAFVWSDSKGTYYHPTITSDFIFLRLAGMASGNDSGGRVYAADADAATDGDNELKWVKLIKEKEKETSNRFPANKDGPMDFAIIVLDDPDRANRIKGLLNMGPKTGFSSQPVWTGRLIMHIDINAFFPACEEIRDPSLKGKPHAVIMTPERDGSITRGAVASCSYEARKYGVRSAMSLSKAKELCNDLILKPVDKEYYGKISHEVMGILEGYADTLEQASIDEAYLDCTNKILEQSLPSLPRPAQMPNNETNPVLPEAMVHPSPVSVEEYAMRIKNSVKAQCHGLACSIGVAPTKSAAKIASDFKKPNGLTVVYAQNLSKFLEPLKVDQIAGVGIKTTKILGDMGIETIGQLARHDVQDLVDKFGKKNGLWMWLVANGKDNDPVLRKEDNLSLSSERTLPEPVKDKAVILDHIIKDLVDELFEKIRRKGYEFKTVGIKLVRSDFTVETRETSFSAYQNSKTSMVSVIEPLLDKFEMAKDDKDSNSRSDSNSYDGDDKALYHNSPHIFVRKIGLKLSNLSKTNKRNASLQRTMLDFI
jgi:DNA polymerase IV (DinB-like DNA polymerase)